jgi:GxxExxY protein
MNKYNIYISNNPVIKFPCIRNFRRLTLGARSLSARQLKYIGFKGPGLLEPIYRKCVRRECELRNIPTRYELIVPIEYKGFVFEEPLRLGLLVDDCLIVELKAVEKVLPIHKAQLLSYMKLLNKPLGLLINFHEAVLKNGIHRLVLGDCAAS